MKSKYGHAAICGMPKVPFHSASDKGAGLREVARSSMLLLAVDGGALDDHPDIRPE